MSVLWGNGGASGYPDVIRVVRFSTSRVNLLTHNAPDWNNFCGGFCEDEVFGTKKNYEDFLDISLVEKRWRFCFSD